MKFIRLWLCSILIVSLTALGHDATAQTSEVDYRESDIGIEYRAIAESPLAEMLSQGEVEFFENATPVFGDETAESWRFMSAEIATGAVSNFTVEDMKEFTPDMLRGFSHISLAHPIYGRLSSLGSLFISEGFLSAGQAPD